MLFSDTNSSRLKPLNSISLSRASGGQSRDLEPSFSTTESPVAPTILFKTDKGVGVSGADSERSSLRRVEPLMFLNVVVRLTVDPAGLLVTDSDDVLGSIPGLGGKGPGVKLDNRLGIGEFVLEETGAGAGLRSCHMVVHRSCHISSEQATSRLRRHAARDRDRVY
jgi:hypothetical protein